MYHYKWQPVGEIIHIVQDEGIITSAQTQEQIDLLLSLLDQAPHKVSVLMDLRVQAKVELDKNFLKLHGIRTYLDHPNLATTVFVGHLTPLLSFWINLLSKQEMPGYQRFDAVDFEEAVRYLLQVNKVQRERASTVLKDDRRN